MSKKKLLFFFLQETQAILTHHCQSFSQFSPNSFSSLFSLILPVTYGFTDYYYQCPLEMQNGRCQSEISNGWRERKKKEWRATFHADDACTAVNLKQQFFFPLLPSSSSPVCTFLVTSPPLKTRRWNNITGFLPTFHKFMFEKKEPQIFNEAYRVSGLNLEWVGMSAILMVFKSKSKSNYFGRFSNTDRASVKHFKT